MRLWLALVLTMCGTAARAGDVAASEPRALSVTVYRAPWRNGGSLTLNNLGGFALITETRVVHLPAGEARLRFEGVVDGIVPESAIVTGLPSGVIEKNRDAAVLSPAALVRAALGTDVTLVRTNAKTGKVTRIPAKIRSADEQGVIFETATGVEALRCAGLPETFSFDRVPAGLSALPTLSVLTRSAREVTATVTLSYLARGFDWAADYTATLNPDGKTLNLGAWITLANGNGVSLPNAQTQIVAGRLNRAYAQQFDNPQPQVIARCWPQGHTSDGSDLTRDGDIVVTARRRSPNLRGMMKASARVMDMAAPAAAPPPPPPPEQLGDLKLYRVPQLTTIAARQSKQTRLLEQHGVPFERIYLADLSAIIAWGPQTNFSPAAIILRTKNDKAHQLGLPLPAGQIALFQPSGARNLYAGEVALRDTAEDEAVELKLGSAPDVQVKQQLQTYAANAPELNQLAPGLLAARHRGRALWRVEISNARAVPISFELRLQLYNGQHVVAADQPIGLKDGRPIFRLAIPANGAATVQYAVE